MVTFDLCGTKLWMGNYFVFPHRFSWTTCEPHCEGDLQKPCVDHMGRSSG